MALITLQAPSYEHSVTNRTIREKLSRDTRSVSFFPKGAWRLCAAVFILWAARGAFGGDLFFHDGRTDWKIYLSPQAGATETFAAEELSTALKKISGADFEVLSSVEVPERRAIVIGDLENSEIEGRASALKLSPGKIEQIAVCTLDGRLYLLQKGSDMIMHRNSIVRPSIWITFAAPVLVIATLCSAAEDDSRWVHPLCEPLSIDSDGPFAKLADGSLMTIDAHGTRCSQDDGQTWSEVRRACEGLDGLRGGGEPASASILQTEGGTIVIVYLDSTTYNFRWDNATNQPKDDCRLEIWAIRSLDGGQTWIDRQRILEGYNPNFFGFIQTRDGRLVATVPHLVRDPGRYVACSLVSDDDGKTWQRSNLIDLGGHGHHSGAMEPTVAELDNGRLLMLIRTHWGRFWEALSDDGGLSWRTVRPSQIESTSAPGFLLKLRSGRLALVCNDKAGRTNLLLHLSEDDGKTWTKPVVLARQKGGQLSYPYCMERRPGELWVIAGFAFQKGWQESLPLRLKIDEEAFLSEAKKAP